MSSTCMSEVFLKYKRIDLEVGSSNSSSKTNEVVRLFAERNEHELGLTEHFYVICLDNSLVPVAIHLLSKGGNDFTPIPIRSICQLVLLSGAMKVVLAHNHPSGKMYPSESDKKVTADIIKALTILEVKVEDHVILSGINNSFYSFRDEGLI